MITQDRIVKSKMSLIELAEYLQSVSEACKTYCQLSNLNR